MNKLTIATLLIALASAGSAFADDITPDTTRDALSLKTRDQVRAELQQARRDGSIRVWSTSYNPLLVAKSVKSREQVRAELAEAQASGEYAALNDDETSARFAVTTSQPANANVAQRR